MSRPSDEHSNHEEAIDELRKRLPKKIDAKQPPIDEYRQKVQAFIDSSRGLSSDVRDFVIYVLLGAITPPRKGRPSEILRDMEIADAVDRAIARNPSLTPFRNDTSPATSACDLVSSYLSKLDIELGYKSVADIYNKQRVPKK